MKKIISLLITLLFLSNTFATTEVQVYWSQSIVNAQAQLFKKFIDNANKSQNKYQFVIVHKPGAGGSIAANQVLNSNKLALFGISSTFYVRPYVTKDSHDPEKFSMMNRLCIDKPMAFYSKKNKIQTGMSVGLAPGVAEIVPILLNKNNPSLNLLSIPYKTTAEATIAMFGGHTMASIDFYGNASNIMRPDISILGLTGKRSINGIPTMHGLENLVIDLFLFAPKNIDPILYTEFHQIFKDAANDETDSLCKMDAGIPAKTSLSAMESLHKEYQEKWKQLTNGIKLE